eukprot:Gregarina_sp_Poly_1__4070@NODE_2237_length_2427_cov_110_241102_g1414_i1_p3_GENE_NODE_2237_length_2427_cov_110_241102_g1414_i1NODE_2237_length_2427_cov_110_241102_g1414_i1_p3_ORF_typecomplete_len154_score19_23LURAP/PF14854_6/0_44LURAP/PF14854_6/1_4e03_NODE_2237_length_2427_cov_110_241102_g1414_i119092370
MRTVSILSWQSNAAREARRAVNRMVGGGGVYILKDLDEKLLHSLLSVQEWIDELQVQYDCYVEIGQRDIVIESNREIPQDAEQVQLLLQQKMQELTELMQVTIAVWDASLLSEIFTDAALTVLRDRTNLQVRISGASPARLLFYWCIDGSYKG